MTLSMAVRLFVKNNIDELSYLYSRWQDEKEYEDFEDYKKAFQKLLPQELVLVRASKRPFSFDVCEKKFMCYKD